MMSVILQNSRNKFLSGVYPHVRRGEFVKWSRAGRLEATRYAAFANLLVCNDACFTA